jgi:uncharacterized membrane protein YkoI
MGSKMNAVVGVAVVVGVLVAAGIGFLVGREDSDESSSTSLETQAQGADSFTGGDQAPPAMNGQTGGNSGNGSSGPGWRTNQLSINQQEATEIATSRFADARVVHAEVDEEDGYYLWEVLVQRSDASYIEILIDAGTGRVVAVDPEGLDP